MNSIKFIVIFSILLSGCVKTIPHENKVPKDPSNARDSMPGNLLPFGSNNPGVTHVVAKGETLFKIAKQNNVSYQDLAIWNEITPPYNIFIGQILRLQASVPEQPSTDSTIFRTPIEPLQNGCEVSVLRIKPFYHSNTFSSFCGWLSACVGASYIIKNNSAQARVVDVIYASNEEQRVLHRALKIEGQNLFTGKVYNVDSDRNSWNIVIEDCFW